MNFIVATSSLSLTVYKFKMSGHSSRKEDGLEVFKRIYTERRKYSWVMEGKKITDRSRSKNKVGKMIWNQKALKQMMTILGWGNIILIMASLINTILKHMSRMSLKDSKNWLEVKQIKVISWMMILWLLEKVAKLPNKVVV